MTMAQDDAEELVLNKDCSSIILTFWVCEKQSGT